MMDEDILVYEQDEVQLSSGAAEEEVKYFGKLQIIEKSGVPIIEWTSTLDDSTDEEWAVISSPYVAFSNKKLTDSVLVNNGKKCILPVTIDVKDVVYCQVTNKKRTLELIDKCDEVIAKFVFHNQHTDFFFDVLRRYVTTRQQDEDGNLFLLQSKHHADIDDKLSALNLVPQRRGSNEHPKLHPHGAGPHWTTDLTVAPKAVWGFLNKMKKDPYNTTLYTLSKFPIIYDVVLYGNYQNQREDAGRANDDVVAELMIHSVSSMGDVEPGFEILTKHEQLSDRPEVLRLNPIIHEEYKTFMDQKGRINEVAALKERIFRGGIHPNLRPELWCYLLGYYEWNSTYEEREEKKRMKEQEYFVMKQQWKTITEDQEKNFSGFRDRKSIIEKDVNRTDRNHPFYEGEINSNLEILNDVLMTFIMYNFDLGYVQGMSDLLAPILYVTQNESTAFWCFVGYMDRVYRNFDLDQSGMKQQLNDLTQVLRILDPQFVSFLQAQDSANLYFCFRWLLVRFKRELNYTDTLRLWEVLWTDYLCPNFHLCVAAAILDTERNEIVEKKFGFTDVLKHINGLALHVDLDATLKKAEAIYLQLSTSPSVPDTVRSILGLPLNKKFNNPPKFSPTSIDTIRGLPGHAERVTKHVEKGEILASSSSVMQSTTLHQEISESSSQSKEEQCYEAGIYHSFI